MQQSMSALRAHAFELLAYSDSRAAFIRRPRHEARFPSTEPTGTTIKRLADIVLAVAGLLLMGIPMLAVAAAIRLTSPGPVLFRQQRVGLNGRPFVMLKFRTMHHATEHLGWCPQATR